ncbi:MAG: low specificity L-threonine aldolase [Halobacteriaceae archaeon]
MLDLRSDTVTQPDEAMRDAACDAEVGDDVYEEDPTVNELEDRAASMLGMDAGLFVPTGTMGNQVAVRTHTDRGQEILVDRQSHVYKWEVGGLAQLSSLQVRTIDAERGVPDPSQIREAYVPESIHRPGTGLVTLENTHNSRGGLAIEPSAIRAAAEAAHDLGCPVHLDGARLFNAAVALDVPVTAFTSPVDTAMFCLSKGLGAPIGSVLVGPSDFIDRARRHRKLLGGGMRQVGIIAAPGLLALENVDRLADDHANATRLARGLDALPGLTVQEPETNIVLIDTTETGQTAEEFLTACREVDVEGSAFDEYLVRFCTHRDLTESDVETAIDRIATVLG